MQVDASGDVPFCRQLHDQQLAVWARCSLAHVRCHEPGAIVGVQLVSCLSNSLKVHQEGRQGVHVIVLITNGDPAVVGQPFDGRRRLHAEVRWRSFLPVRAEKMERCS